ncbi:hypothetical protein BJ170DRAFT_690339 [Xylariales sp. AK1849]|nr:hypothetical protein BJ170DRAFT_690339 [Xylariales sp. AK1849]
MTSQLEVTGTVLKRLAQAGTLLWLLDPVRGEPTIHSLDRHPSDSHQEAADRQSSKFLDSISLICATRKDGDTVSAATMEEGAPEGTIIRIASNAGLQERTLRLVKEIMKMLNDVAEAGFPSPDAEKQMLSKIIELDTEKIMHYLGKIRRYSPAIHEDVDWIIANFRCLDVIFEPRELSGFLEWIAGLRLLTKCEVNPDQSETLAHIQWATKAKWVYSRFLEATFKVRGAPMSPWVVNVQKLGRYAVASQVLLHFAAGNRSLFCPMLIEALPAPPKQRYQPSSEENHLDAALRRSIGGDTGGPTMRLGRYWNVSNPELHFRRKCPRELTVHAELQLVNFYDHNRDRMPRKRFIGVSKKSCFLCYKFLQQHPFNFAVSACHQKLYLNWVPPPCCNHKIYKQYKKLAVDLSVAMETAAKHDIEQKLGMGARRPVPLDSTAGVSLPVALIQHEMHQPDIDLEHCDFVSMGDTFEQEDCAQHPANPNSAEHGSDELSMDDEEYFPSDDGRATDEVASPVMTFHVKRTDDRRRQDIVTITELIDPLCERPTWELLCVILASDDRFGVGFDHAHEFLLINQRLRVGSDRQFTACLEFLRNAQSWNNEASVHTYEELDGM